MSSDVRFAIKECADLRHKLRRAEAEIDRLRDALRLLRGLVKEGDVPRYSVTSGAALNAVIEEVVDPVLGTNT